MNENALSPRQAGGSDVAGLTEAAGAALVFIGAYVPWVMTVAFVATVSVRGVDTDYARVLPILPLLALGLLAWRWYVRRARWIHLVVAVLGVAAIVMAGRFVVMTQRGAAHAQQSLTQSVGPLLPGTVAVRFDIGIYLTVAGGAAMIVGGILGARQDRRAPRSG